MALKLTVTNWLNIPKRAVYMYSSILRMFTSWRWLLVGRIGKPFSLLYDKTDLLAFQLHNEPILISHWTRG